MLWPVALWVCAMPGAQAPVWLGDADGPRFLEADLQAAMRSTEGFGAMPQGAWALHLHTSDTQFEKATGAPPQRAMCWVGDTLHLRPLETLRRREVGAILRHELVHRRLAALKLRAWEEEARCLFAEGHTRPPDVWPKAPTAPVQDKLDLALRRGTTASQAWAYAWLRLLEFKMLASLYVIENLPLPAGPFNFNLRDRCLLRQAEYQRQIALTAITGSAVNRLPLAAQRRGYPHNGAKC